MKEYFYHLLQNLDKLTGIQQYHKLLQHPEWKKEINLLLDILCGVCDKFPYIPEDAKKRILDTSVVTDGDFIGLNAKFVYKHLMANKDRYFKELAHQDTKPEAEPLTGEAMQEKINWALAELAKAQAPIKQRINPYKDMVQQFQPPAGEKYHRPDYDAGQLQDLKIQYGREHTDKYTGKVLPGHPTFKEWVKSLDQN
jgi:hypothetical protein